jgi:hypothetical protein
VYSDSLKIVGPEHIYEAIEGLSILRLPDTRAIAGEPLPKPRHALPPELSQLDNVSARWHEIEDNATVSGFDESACPSMSEEGGVRQPLCHLRMFPINGDLEPGSGIMETIEPFVVENDGWEAASDRKEGLVPSKPNA